MLEDGAYGRLMDRYYATEAGIPDGQQHRMARATTKQEQAAVQAVLDEFFRLVDGFWIHARCESEIARYRAKQDKARASINKRWEYARNTNVLPTNNEGNTPRARSSHQTPVTNKAKAKKGAHAPTVAELLTGVDPVVVADFTEHRRALKFPINETGLKGIIREAGKAGLSLEAALRLICERGWRGFKADWVNEARGPPGKQSTAAPSKHLTGVAGFLGVNPHDLIPSPGVVLAVDRPGPSEPVLAGPRRLPGE